MGIVNDYTAILGGDYWSGSDASAAPAFITYSFETLAQDHIPAGSINNAMLNSFARLNAGEKAEARAAIDAWASISGIVAIEVKAGEGDIRFGKYDFNLDPSHSSAAGYAYLPYTDTDANFSYRSDIGGDVFLDYGYADEPYTLLHEVGHALGFKHPFEGSVTLGSKFDDTDHTVMSYTGTRVDHLSPFDVEAVQAIYGDAASDAADLASWNFNAKTSTLNRTGLDSANTIYGVGIRDVIDGGGGGDLICGFEGEDTLKGGSGQDTIYGGIGNDTIRGDKGADKLLGEEGNDTFEFTAVNTGGDTVMWFSQVAGDRDTLAFSEKAFGSLGRDADGTGTLLGSAFQAGFGHVASTADTHFLYDWSNGQLWYDADGTGSKAAKLLLTLNNFADLAAADIVIF